MTDGGDHGAGGIKNPLVRLLASLWVEALRIMQVAGVEMLVFLDGILPTKLNKASIGGGGLVLFAVVYKKVFLTWLGDVPISTLVVPLCIVVGVGLVIVETVRWTLFDRADD